MSHANPPRRSAPQPLVFETTTRRLVVAEAGLVDTLHEAAAVIDQGGLVVFPTESFYGLAANPRDPDAVARLVAAKGRGASKAIPLIAATVGHVRAIGDLPPAAVKLAEAFWPCPLTMAIEPRAAWPAAILGGTGTVGVRVSDHEVARRLAAAAGGLITATSANHAGAPPVTAVDDLDRQLVAGTQLIVDSGLCGGGAPSTVVGFDGDRVTVLRSGAVDLNALKAVVGRKLRIRRD